METCNEIERKFLVNEKKLDEILLPQPYQITQGYLMKSPEGSVRVRMESRGVAVKSCLTVKKKAKDGSNNEYTFRLSTAEATAILEDDCIGEPIVKKRYEIQIGNVTWEIDEFLGSRQGLIIAEVELQHLSEDERKNLVFPDWIGKEVTGDPAYYNANM